jgi:SAM-dependent methyltransferase
MGDLDRVTPISADWGFDRGQPVDRFYIESFLKGYAADIRGRVLEVADNEYTRRFGGDRVLHSDILHDAPGHPRASRVMDLANPPDAIDAVYDCVICTQTLHLIYDIAVAVGSLRQLLKPGGVLLLTVPTITAISRADMNRHGDYWRFTSAALQKLLDQPFGRENVRVQAYGNVYAATAFLHGLAVSDVEPQKLIHFDPDYETLVGARAVAAGTT